MLLERLAAHATAARAAHRQLDDTLGEEFRPLKRELLSHLRQARSMRERVRNLYLECTPDEKNTDATILWILMELLEARATQIERALYYKSACQTECSAKHQMELYDDDLLKHFGSTNLNDEELSQILRSCAEPYLRAVGGLESVQFVASSSLAGDIRHVHVSMPVFPDDI